ncbi:MAG: metallophosphoesterase family protein [Deltaproteobacteria bacterium]|nr:metallophosphoesterase family protein [Deltaproteobacteria bacterium]
MFICAAGDNHGAIDQLYSDVIAFEESLGVRFDYVIHVGDFGIWPDPDRIDKATRKHEGAGDFPAWYTERQPVPRPTVFIKGNHEDFVWLDAHPTGEILDGLRYLKNGYTTELVMDEGAIVVGGIGGCFGTSDYERSSRNLQGYARRHYTCDEIERLCKYGRLDILLLHDAPAGVEFTRRLRDGRESRYVSEVPGLVEALECTRPRVCFFGHHHRRVDAEIAGISCIGLNIVGRPGNLVGFDVPVRGRDWSVLGEWASV